MRSEQEIKNLILKVAKGDKHIRGVLLVGSRANSNAPKDSYMDYDITYYVNDVAPFYNNVSWIEKHFGKPLMMQMPENMRDPIGDGRFTYLMIFSDGNRIDLSFLSQPYIYNREPALVLLDKDGVFPSSLPTDDQCWHITPPTKLDYESCCNNFWWCLNNVAKGIMRDELPYVMHMLNRDIRSELHDMINWYIGTQKGFDLSTGKEGKYFKRYLSQEMYQQYVKTFPGGTHDEIWNAVFILCDLFHTFAFSVAAYFGFLYNQKDEDGIREYLRKIKSGGFYGGN